jgi:hypothetical protein
MLMLLFLDVLYVSLLVYAVARGAGAPYSTYIVINGQLGCLQLNCRSVKIKFAGDP